MRPPSPRSARSARPARSAWLGRLGRLGRLGSAGSVKLAGSAGSAWLGRLGRLGWLGSAGSVGSAISAWLARPRALGCIAEVVGHVGLPLNHFVLICCLCRARPWTPSPQISMLTKILSPEPLQERAFISHRPSHSPKPASSTLKSGGRGSTDEVTI